MIKKQIYVSNLCWKKKDMNFVIDILKKENISGIDFAPLNYFTSWKNVLKKSRRLSSLFKKKKLRLTQYKVFFLKKN